MCLQSLGITINPLITEAVLGRDGGVRTREGWGGDEKERREVKVWRWMRGLAWKHRKR